MAAVYSEFIDYKTGDPVAGFHQLENIVRRFLERENAELISFSHSIIPVHHEFMYLVTGIIFYKPLKK